MFMVLSSLERSGTKCHGRLSNHDVMSHQINLSHVLKHLHRFYLDCNVRVM